MFIVKAAAAIAIAVGLSAAAVSFTGPNRAHVPELQTELAEAVSVDSRPGAPIEL